MFRLLTILAGIVMLAVAGFGVANAAPGYSAYSASSFDAAQKAGKTIVVDVHADWCPTCKAQAPILSEIAADKRAKDVVFIQVDFDDDKAFLREHRIPRQSTVLVFKGDKEVGRSVAETNRARLRGFVFDRI